MKTLILLLFSCGLIHAQGLLNLVSGVPTPSGGGGSIAYTAGSFTDLGETDAVTTFSHAYTAGSAANTILFCGVMGDNSGSADDVIAPTYNSVTMTIVTKNVVSATLVTSYLYRLVAPASGSHTFTVTSSSAHRLGAVCWEYNGTTAIDTFTFPVKEFNQASVGGDNNVPITTTAANTWTVMLYDGYNGGTAPTAGTATTLRGCNASYFNVLCVYDSNANIASAGATSLNFVTSTLTTVAAIIASIK